MTSTIVLCTITPVEDLIIAIGGNEYTLTKKEKPKEKKWQPRIGELCYVGNTREDCRYIAYIKGIKEFKDGSTLYETSMGNWSECLPLMDPMIVQFIPFIGGAGRENPCPGKLVRLLRLNGVVETTALSGTEWHLWPNILGYKPFK